MSVIYSLSGKDPSLQKKQWCPRYDNKQYLGSMESPFVITSMPTYTQRSRNLLEIHLWIKCLKIISIRLEYLKPYNYVQTGMGNLISIVKITYGAFW